MMSKFFIEHPVLANVLAIVLVLIGAVGFLLSQLNARTFTLQMQDGKLLVMKGRMLPLGSEPYRPAEPALAASTAIPAIRLCVPGTRTIRTSLLPATAGVRKQSTLTMPWPSWLSASPRFTRAPRWQPSTLSGALRPSLISRLRTQRSRAG